MIKVNVRLNAKNGAGDDSLVLGKYAPGGGPQDSPPEPQIFASCYT